MKKNQASFRSVTENPCNMCMPMGGIIPFKGIQESMVMLHGSQGCATYMRRHISAHFNEPIDVASSSLNEKGTVYGGEKNLIQGLDNLIKLYNPQLIGVLTTCLAETIGEDIDRITADYLKEKGLTDFPIVTVPTPGYGGTHTEGYWLATKQIVVKLATNIKKHSKINIIVPDISPADIREIKRILDQMQVDYVLFPDYSDNLDRPYEKPYLKVPKGGTKINDIVRMPGAPATVQIGATVEDNMSPGKYLENQFGVPLYNVPIPIGLENTDIFIETLKNISGKSAPDSLKQERGRLMDCMIDSHKYNFAGRSAVFGEPEIVYAVAGACAENGITPLVIATGSRNSVFTQQIKSNIDWEDGEPQILYGTDFAAILKSSKEMNVNIAIGPSDGKFLTEKGGIPLVRLGFPIHDRVGGQRILSAGYTGTAMLLDRLTNTLLENKYKNYRQSMYQKFYPIAKRR